MEATTVIWLVMTVIVVIAIIAGLLVASRRRTETIHRERAEALREQARNTMLKADALDPDVDVTHQPRTSSLRGPSD